MKSRSNSPRGRAWAQQMTALPLYTMRLQPILPADLGEAGAGYGAAQADRRLGRLCRELGDLRLPRPGERRSGRQLGRHDDSRIDTHERRRAARGGALAARTVPAPDQIHRCPSGPLGASVHPDDATCRRLAGDNGKTETWVILQVEPGSAIYAGLKHGIGRNEFAAAIGSGQVEPLLHRLEPKPGDSILIDSGTVHAIGAGVLLAEIQQTSDATFRIHDWGRFFTRPRRQPQDTSRPPGLGVDQFPARTGRANQAGNPADSRRHAHAKN